MTLKSVRHVFIIGIKGAGMANIALFLRDMGIQVSGSDVADEFITDTNLTSRGITIIPSFDPAKLPNNVDLVLYSASHGGSNNPQVLEAAKREAKLMHQAQFLGELVKIFKRSVAVCGTHGKTNTASLLVFLLHKLGAKPSYIVGAPSFNDVAGGGYAGDDFFVLEADEYAVDPPHDKTPKLEFIHPSFALCTSIDFDHPDVYKDINHTKEEFLGFFKKIIGEAASPKLFLCLDDDNIMSLAKQLPRESYIGYGFSPYADFMVSNVITVGETTLLDLTNNGTSVGSFSTKLAGDKLVGNVSGVIAMLMAWGFTADDIKEHLSEFKGARRRFEFIASINGIDLYDDYAHHPHEIETTIEAARAKFPDRKLVIIFQPHTFSRTEALKDEFISALSKTDETYLAPIFASAREDASQYTITTKSLADLATQKGIRNIRAFETADELKKLLHKSSLTNAVIFTMGAGDVYKLKNDIIEALPERK